MEEERKKWEDLDSDCLLTIFQKLRLEDLILVVPFVCRSWHKASLDPFCWRILDFQSSDFTTRSKFARQFPGFMKLAIHRSRKQAVELRFPHFASIDDVVVSSDECPRLKILALPNLGPHDELRIPQLIGKWKELERLEMDLKPSCFPELLEQIGINCSNFSELAVCGLIGRGDALAIVNCTAKLRGLDLSRSYLPKEELVVIMKGCRELERLRANCCIGFQVNKDLLEIASGIKIFEHEGSKLWDCYHKQF